MRDGQPILTFLAEVGSPRVDSPAYESRPILARSFEDAKRQAQEWVIVIRGMIDQPHHLRLVQDDQVIWTQSYGAEF